MNSQQNKGKNYTKSAVVAQSSRRADKFHTTSMEQRVEGVVVGNVNGPAGRVTFARWHVATLWFTTGGLVVWFSTLCHIVIDQLSPGGQEYGDGVIV